MSIHYPSQDFIPQRSMRALPHYFATMYDVALARDLHDKKLARDFHPDFGNRFLRMCNELEAEGFKVTLASGVRSVATQMLQIASNPYAAKGLRSPHLYGCGGDVHHDRSDGRSEIEFVRAFRRIARECDLETIHGWRERNHVQLPRKEFHAGLRSGRYHLIGHLNAKAEALVCRYLRMRRHKHRRHFRHNANGMTRHSHSHRHHHHGRHHRHAHRPGLMAMLPKPKPAFIAACAPA